MKAIERIATEFNDCVNAGFDADFDGQFDLPEPPDFANLKRY
jgi:hypothetical protein